MSIFPPLEFNKPLLEKYNIKNDNILDWSQCYNLFFSNYDLNFIYHDNTTKIFSTIFNKIEYYIFETIFMNLILESRKHGIDITIYHIKSESTKEKLKSQSDTTIIYEVKQFYFDSAINNISILNINITKKILSQKIDLIPGKIILCLFEYVENEEFGHYGTMYYDGIDKIHIFDSMMYSTRNTVVQYNNDIFFDKFITKLFNIDTTKHNIIYDIYTDTSDNIYSFEITGGSYYVENQLLLKNKLKGIGGLSQYIIGVDNQNQYCYMWGILNLILNIYFKIEQKDSTFIKFHQFLIDKKYIPVVIIKLFLSILILHYKPINYYIIDYNLIIKKYLLDEPFFTKNFNKFITNNLNYNEIHTDENPVFKSYSFTINQENDTDSLFQIINYFIKNIQNIQFFENPPIIYKPFTSYVEDIITKHTIFKELITNVNKQKNIHTYLINHMENLDDIKIKRKTKLFGGFTFYKFINL